MSFVLTKCMRSLKPVQCLESIKGCRLTFCSKKEDDTRQAGKFDSTQEEFDDSNEDFIELEIPEPKYVNVNKRKNLLDAFKDDMKQTAKFIKNPSKETLRKRFIPNHYDVAIFGAGPVGSTLAYELKAAISEMQIIVIDGDLSPNRFTKTDAAHLIAPQLTLGHITQQFSLKENILLAKNSADYFRNVESHLDVFDDDDPPKTSYRPFGHLSLATNKGHIMLKENHIQQSKYGVHTELTTSYQLSQRFPWLNLDDISLGCLGTLNEGMIDPWEYMLAIRSAAMRRGAIFMEAVPLEFHFRTTRDFVGYAPGTYQSPHSIVLKESDGNLREVDFCKAIVALGPETGRFMKEFLYLSKDNKGVFKLEVPITKKKHYVFCFESELPGPDFSSPMVKDPSGVYFRRNGYTNQYICGCTLPMEDPSENDLHVDSKIFYDFIWPVLAHRVPAFEKLQLKSGWAFFEDHNSFDGSPIVGYHPSYDNVMVAAGFGRHGFLYAPGIAKALCEHLCENYYSTLDLTRFNYNRIAQDEPLVEPLII